MKIIIKAKDKGMERDVSIRTKDTNLEDLLCGLDIMFLTIKDEYDLSLKKTLKLLEQYTEENEVVGGSIGNN